MVRRQRSLMLVTDGISDPWDTRFHSKPESWTFDFELALEIPTTHLPLAPEGAWEEALAGPLPEVLWALADFLVSERVDLKGRLLHAYAVTLAAPPIAGLEKLLATNGYIGVLVGIPFVGLEIGASAVLAPLPNDDAVWLLTAKLLLPEEYEFGLRADDAGRLIQMVEAFLSRERHLSWLDRPSILPFLAQ
jgi:hypothetical protein